MKKDVVTNRTPRKWNIPLTYPPKIQPAKEGTIDQTIMSGVKYSIGDLIRFFDWSGKPYRSKWVWVIPNYRKLIHIEELEINKLGIKKIASHSIGDIPSIIKPLNKTLFWEDLDFLAKLDGIKPATGLETKRILEVKNGKAFTMETERYQLIKWEGAKKSSEAFE